MSRAWPIPTLDRGASLGVNARHILRVRIAEFYAYAPIVADPAAVEPLHDLRIAAKRLRYSLELFRRVLGAAADEQIERIKSLQEYLGLIHDLDVRIALIEADLLDLAREQTAAVGAALAASPAERHRAITTAALRPPPDDPRRGLLALLGRQYAARRASHAAFVAHWNDLHAGGMRRDLVGLTVAPLAAETSPPSQE